MPLWQCIGSYDFWYALKSPREIHLDSHQISFKRGKKDSLFSWSELTKVELLTYSLIDNYVRRDEQILRLTFGGKIIICSNRIYPDIVTLEGKFTLLDEIKKHANVQEINKRTPLWIIIVIAVLLIGFVLCVNFFFKDVMT